MFHQNRLPQFPGNKLLFHAVQHINIADTIKLLDEKEADIHANNVNNQTPLHIAVYTRNQNLVEILLKCVFNADTRQTLMRKITSISDFVPVCTERLKSMN
jgi:hypothetical protein